MHTAERNSLSVALPPEMGNEQTSCQPEGRKTAEQPTETSEGEDDERKEQTEAQPGADQGEATQAMRGGASADLAVVTGYATHDATGGAERSGGSAGTLTGFVTSVRNKTG